MESILIIGWLYFIQGIPYGIQDKFIPLYLHLQNLSFTSISLMKILLFPWICKGLWAPFVQIYYGPYIWLLTSVFGLSIISFNGWCMSEFDVWLISLLLLAMNIFSAIQEIATDGFALIALGNHQLGIANSIQVVLYKVGSLLGGAGFMYISYYTSWNVSYLCLCIVYSFSVFLLLLKKSIFKHVWGDHVPMLDKKETISTDKIPIPGPVNKEISSPNYNKEISSPNYNKEISSPNYNKEISSPNYNKEISSPNYNKEISSPNYKKGLNSVHSIFREVFDTEGMLKICLYVAVYKMGERGAINNFPLYLSDQGVQSSDLAFWNGIVSQVSSILGSIFGGWKLTALTFDQRQNTNRILKLYTIYRSLAILAFYFIIEFWNAKPSDLKNFYYYLSMISLVSLNFFSGVISTVTFTLMMEQSRKLHRESQATHYSCLASVEVAGKLIFATFAGYFIDLLNINRCFLLFFALSAVPCFLL